MRYDTADFERQVLQRSHEVPVLVDFWAPWCGPCRTLGPVLERLAAAAGGRWELVKVNTEENQELAMTFNVTSIPAVKLFVNGEVADEFVGARPEPEIRRFLDQAIPSPHAPTLEAARQQLEAGDPAAAAALLEPVVQADPHPLEARWLLARALWREQPERVPDLLAPVGPLSEYAEPAEALRILARVALLPDRPDSLPLAKVRDLYLAGAAALRSGQDAAALEAFIGVLEKDKDYHGGAAKAAARALFQFLGLRHPLTERYFRAFSSALHS